MHIQVLNYHIIDENHVSLRARNGNQEYVVFLKFQKKYYELTNVVHELVGECPYCKKMVDKGSKCVHFMVNAQDATNLESVIEMYMNATFFTNKEQTQKIILQKKWSKKAKEYEMKIKQLEDIAKNKKEKIQYFTNDFEFYVTERDGKKIFVNLKGEEKRKRKAELIEKTEVTLSSYEVATNKPVVTNHLKEMELSILQQYDVSLTKWNKMYQIIESLRKTINLYNQIHEEFKGQEFQELIAYLNEVLYREIPLSYQNDTELMEQHNQAKTVLYSYINGVINYDECVNRLVKDPSYEGNNRKDRIIFAIRALQKTEEVYAKIQHKKDSNAYLWLQDMLYKLTTYLIIDLGISFMINKKERKELEDFLFITLKKFFSGKLEEAETYRVIDAKIPFIKETTFEKINRFLQEKSKEEGNRVYYLMEIPYQNDLLLGITKHEAYKHLEEVKATPCDFLEGKEDNSLKKWLVDDENVYVLKSLIQELEKEYEAIKIWRVKVIPPRKNEEGIDEYIIFNGESLYRLHFREG